MEEHEALLELGLTSNESKVYQVLLMHNKLGAGDISKFSRVPYSRIYDVLSSLEQKGFIKVVPEKSKKFVPTSPETFNEFIKKKEERIDFLKNTVKKLREAYDKREREPVILGYGKPGFYKIVKEGIEPQNYSYSIKFTSEHRPDWEANYRRDLKKKNLEKKELVRISSQTKANIKKWLDIGKKNMRGFDNDGVAMSITDDQEVMIGLIKSNTTLLIKDRPFAKIMRKLFLSAYTEAEVIK